MHHLRHDRPSISPTYAHKCSHGHMYLVLDTFRRTKSPNRLSGRWSRLVRQLSDAPPRHDRASISPPYAHKCSHGHMYLVLETFIRAESPTRLSGGWSRIVRHLSDAPPQARSSVNLPSIRAKMFPWTHVPCARHLHPCRIARSAKLQVEPNCTTTLSCTTSGTIDRPSPLHTPKNVPTDTCTLCSTPSSVQNRPLG